MNGKRLIVTLAAMLAVIAGVPVASAVGSSSSNPHGQPTILALTAVGSAFTYQGRLTDSGSPANAAYDFQFLLYDTLTGGAQIGSTQVVGDLAVTNGLFTTTMDFGGTAFDGNARWLEIQVRPGVSTGTYTVLSPRQPITATPYALWAKAAGGIGVPFSATGTTTGAASLFDLQQSGTGVGISAEAPSGTGASFTGATGVFAGGAGAATTALQIDNGALKVSGANPTAFIHTVSAATIAAAPDCINGHCTRIDNPLTNGDPNAIVIAIVRQPGNANPHPISVGYANGYWRIANSDHEAMPSNTVFNVLVIKQ